jgi:thioredoxin reductase (NADPH)
MHDLIIIGGGPAGMTAGIYAARARMDALLIEKAAHGGQMLTTFHIENYPGFPQGISGFDLGDLMRRQAEDFELPIHPGEVVRVVRGGGVFTLHLADGTSVDARAVILATGATPNRLGVPGEERLTGRGVSYCATCDGALYRGRRVAVIGGGDSAAEEALFLTRFAERVHLVHRRDALRALALTAERVAGHAKIAMHWDTVATAVEGETEVSGLALKNVKSGEESHLPVEGVFIYVGIKPRVFCLDKLAELDGLGYVVTDKKMATRVPGLFAAGDVRSEGIRQISSAVGDGATAAFYAYRHILEHRDRGG